jgi:hypothetical protein
LACCWPQVENFEKKRIPSNLGPIQGHKVQHLLIAWGLIENIFFYFSLDPSVKPLGLIENIFFYFSLDPSLKALGG